MEEIVRKTLLFDFYGELLTKHQQEIYDAVVLNDTGYSEVAQDTGITRQGVHDLVKRCDRQLEEYEQKLHLVAKFLRIRDQVRSIREQAQETVQTGQPLNAQEIIKLSDEILEEL